MKKKTLYAAIMIGSVFGASAALADSDMQQNTGVDKDALEKELGIGHDRSYYRNNLENRGFAITSVNVDDADYLEYEVIKNGKSYEIQIDFDNGVASGIDVAANLWEAESTRNALADENYQYQYPASVSGDGEQASDRKGRENWQADKDRIEEQLGVGHDRAYYTQAMERMGYQITSVNEDDADQLEMEVVKNGESYELEVKFDDETRQSTSVDMKSNFWETEATERAKGEES